MKHATKRKIKGGILKGLVYFCAAFTVLILVALLGYIFVRGIPNITWQLLSARPSAIRDTIGILPEYVRIRYILYFLPC